MLGIPNPLSPWLWHHTRRTSPGRNPQQITAQTSDDSRAFASAASTVCPSTPALLVAHHVQQRPGQIGFARCVFEQPTGVGRRRWDRSSSCLRFLQQKASLLGCVERSSFRPEGLSANTKLNCRGPSFSIHLLLCSAGFHQPPRSYEEIRLLRRLVPSLLLLQVYRLRGPRRPPWVSSLDVRRSRPIPPGLEWILGVAFPDTLTRRPACTEVHFRSVLRFVSALPHTASRRQRRRLTTASTACSCLRLAVLPSRPRRTSPPIQCPCSTLHFERQPRRLPKPREIGTG